MARLISNGRDRSGLDCRQDTRGLTFRRPLNQSQDRLKEVDGIEADLVSSDTLESLADPGLGLPLENLKSNEKYGPPPNLKDCEI